MTSTTMPITTPTAAVQELLLLQLQLLLRLGQRKPQQQPIRRRITSTEREP